MKSILHSRAKFTASARENRVRTDLSNHQRSRSSDAIVEPDWNNIYDGAAFGTFVEISTGSPQSHDPPSGYNPLMDGVHVRREFNIAMHDLI